MANLPSKIVAEYYLPAKGNEKKRLLYRYTISEVTSLDKALWRAKERAVLDGKRVFSASFRANESGQIDTIVVYVGEDT